MRVWRCSAFNKFLLRYRNNFFLAFFTKYKKKTPYVDTVPERLGPTAQFLMNLNFRGGKVGAEKNQKRVARYAAVTRMMAQDISEKYQPQIHRPLEYLDLA